MELKFSQTCGGAVFVYSQGRRSAVSAQNWTEAEGARLCQDLKCGNFLSSSAINSVESFWNTSFSCTNVENPKSIWDCEKPWLASQDQQKQLFIQCQGKNLFLLDLCHMMTLTFWYFKYRCFFFLIDSKTEVWVELGCQTWAEQQYHIYSRLNLQLNQTLTYKIN